MPFDFPMDVPARIIDRLARAGVLKDAAKCDIFLMDRVSDEKRITWMRVLHPTSNAAVCG